MISYKRLLCKLAAGKIGTRTGLKEQGLALIQLVLENILYPTHSKDAGPIISQLRLQIAELLQNDPYNSSLKFELGELDALDTLLCLDLVRVVCGARKIINGPNFSIAQDALKTLKNEPTEKNEFLKIVACYFLGFPYPFSFKPIIPNPQITIGKKEQDKSRRLIDQLLANGLIAKNKVGKFQIFRITDRGMTLLKSVKQNRFKKPSK